MSNTIEKTRLDEEQRPLRRLLPGPQLDERYSITPMTRWRWRKTRVLPPPDTIINGREYWYEETLDKADRARLREAMKSPVKRNMPPPAKGRARATGLAG